MGEEEEPGDRVYPGGPFFFAVQGGELRAASRGPERRPSSFRPGSRVAAGSALHITGPEPAASAARNRSPLARADSLPAPPTRPTPTALYPASPTVTSAGPTASWRSAGGPTAARPSTPARALGYGPTGAPAGSAWSADPWSARSGCCASRTGPVCPQPGTPA